MEPAGRVEFKLPATADNVPLLRHAIAGLGEALEMDGPTVADLKTVLTEACMNVVAHAYDGDPGPLEVSAGVESGELVLQVRDYGQGVRPLADVERRSLRLGLPLIAALTDSFEIRNRPGERGTLVTMRMRLAPNSAEAERDAPEVAETEIVAPAGELLATVLSRAISMFAARADFSVDRLSDAVLLSDAISSQGPDRFPDGRARIAVSEEDGAFSIRVGPLDEGGAQQLIDGMHIPELDASLRSLADEVTVESSGSNEHLLVRIARPDG